MAGRARSRGRVHHRLKEPHREVEGLGLQRIWYDGGRYAYASALLDGYTDHILLIIDMADVSFIDSSGLSELIVAFKAGEAVGTDVIVRNPSQRVRFVLGVTGLMSVLAVVPETP